MSNLQSELCNLCGSEIITDADSIYGPHIVKNCDCNNKIWNRSMREKLDEFLRDVEKEKNKRGLLQNRKEY